MLAYLLAAFLSVFGWGLLCVMVICQKIFGGAYITDDGKKERVAATPPA